MGKELRDTIKDITHRHLKKFKSQVFGQNLTGVGWVAGTLPKLFEKDGVIELPMADVAGGGDGADWGGRGWENRRGGGDGDGGDGDKGGWNGPKHLDDAKDWADLDLRWCKKCGVKAYLTNSTYS